MARDVQLSAGPTLFVQADDYTAVLRSVNPDVTSVLPNVLAVSGADGLTDAEVVDRINAQSDELDALTKNDAADETPGVSQVRQSFIIIFFLYGLVVPCVTGLFFLIVTFQKSGALTLLRAIGAPARRLVWSLLFQATLIVSVGYLIGLALYTPVSQQRLGGIPLRLLAIAPMEATTGGGNR